MEVYVLDELLRREKVVDLFESLIWTERWQANGDFELVLPSTRSSRDLFTKGTRLVINESHRGMTCETAETKSGLLTVSGRSFEMMMEDRVAMDGMQGLNTNPNWVITDTPGNIVRTIFKKICIDGLLSPNDKIPFIQNGSITPAGTLLEPDSVVIETLEPKSVYEAVKELCSIYGLGFRLIRNRDTSQLYFEVYMGSDRTTRQKLLPAVIFSQDFDNLTNVSSLTSQADYKNVAYVFGKKATRVVYAGDVNPDVAGFERRVLMVKADNVDDALVGSALNDALDKLGYDALAAHRMVDVLDGEISQLSKYKYGVDYNLGDTVEMRNTEGLSNNMRVTEQIFVADHEGVRSYPTLELDSYVNPGSWLGWDRNQQWNDNTQTWATL